MRRGWPAGIGTLLVLAGCAGAPAPQEQFYRLEVEPPTRRLGAPLVRALVVDRVDGQALLHQRPLVFAEAGSDAALHQYHYHSWVEPPTALIGEELADYLRAAGVAGTVVTPRLRVPADWELIGRLRRFERLVGEGGARAVVELELAVRDRGTGALVWRGDYRAERAAAGPAVTDTVAALAEATREAFAGFVRDLEAL